MSSAASQSQSAASAAPAPCCGAGGFGCLGPQAILYLAGASVFWLAAALLLTLTASLQLVSPGFMEGCPWLHFGHVRPAAQAAFIYGFASQAGLAFVLWLFSREGKTPVLVPGAILIGTFLWNLGVTYGVTKIACCGGTGFQWLEFPLGASRLMLIGYLLVAVPALMTHRARTVWATAPPQWFALAALFAFPWLFITANWLLLAEPVRGVVQISTNAWFVAGLSNLWLAPLALSVVLHGIGSVAPLNRSMLAFAFWSLVAFGAWTGLQPGSPVPAWLSSLSGAFALGLVIPALFISLAVLPVFASGRVALFGNGGFGFMALQSFAGYALLTAAASFPAFSAVVGFTPFMDAIQVALLFGLAGMALLGALNRLLPEILDAPLPKPGWITPSFLLSAAGLALWIGALLVAGIARGVELADASKPFLNAMAAGRPFLALALAGCALFTAGFALFAFNFTLQLWSLRTRCNCAEWLAVDKTSTSGVRP